MVCIQSHLILATGTCVSSCSCGRFSGQEFCVDLSGARIAVGQRYQPYIDEPCVECICAGLSRNGGENAETCVQVTSCSQKFWKLTRYCFLHVFRCMTTQCAQPRCADYQLVEGKCCDYTCPGDDDVIEEAARRQEGPLDISQGDLPAAQPSVFNGMTRISF